MFMKKTYLCIGIVLFLGAVAALGIYLFSRSLTYQHYAEKARLKESFYHMHLMQEAVNTYLHKHKALPQNNIHLKQLVMEADLDLSHGKWDELGVYTTPHFIYMGTCYSTWCYVEATRKDNLYSLYMEHNGQQWIIQTCGTENTELGRRVCQQLQPWGWKYLEGEN